MALTYRSPLEELVGTFEPAAQSLIANVAVACVHELEEELHSKFNYALKAEAKEHLCKAGIYLSPHSAMSHSHPVCKTLENYILYSVLPSKLNNEFFFLGIKAFKLQFLKRRHKNVKLVECINRYVTSADIDRYSNDFTIRESAPHVGLKRHAFELNKPTLRDLIPTTLLKGVRKLFMHDELHYWSLPELCTFLEVVKPEQVLGTLVYPPELLKGSPISLNKWCYTYEIHRDKFFFYPDGVKSEGYLQPLNGGYLLTASKIRLADGSVYCVDVVMSKFAHHLISITRGERLSMEYRSFGPFEAVSGVGLNEISKGKPVCYPIPYWVVSKVYRYLRTLKKPDEQSAMAKLSQILPDPTGYEISFLEEFAKLVIKTGTVRTMINSEGVKTFFGKYLGKLPTCLAKKITVVREVSLQMFIAALEPYSFTIPTRTLDYNSTFGIDFFDWSEVEEGYDIVEAMERVFMYGNMYVLADRSPSEYMGYSLVDGRHKLVHFSRTVMRRVISSLLYRSFMNEYRARISVDVCAAKIKLIAQACSPCAQHVLYGVISDEELIVGITARANALNVTRIRFHFFQMGVDWFLSNRRYYTKFLDQNSHNAHGYRDVHAKMHGIFGALRDTGIEKAEFVKEGVVQEGTGKGGGIDFSALLQRAVDRKDEEMLEKRLSCTCGIEMCVTRCHYAELHGCTFPDDLRGRKAQWFSKGGTAYCYTGAQHLSHGWPEWLPEFVAVNELPDVGYDCMLAQQYEADGRIGFHADDEEIFQIGCPILTLNVLGSATFEIKGHGCSGKIVLGPGEYFTMPAGFQVSHKHSVHSCSEKRVSMTFRVLNKDPAEGSTPLNSDGSDRSGATPGSDESDSGDEHLGPTDECNKDCDSSEQIQHLRITRELFEEDDLHMDLIDHPKDGNCFWHAVEGVKAVDHASLREIVRAKARDQKFSSAKLEEQLAFNVFAEDESIIAACLALDISISVFQKETRTHTKFMNDKSDVLLMLHLANEHFQTLMVKNACVPKALADSLGRPIQSIVKVIEQHSDEIDGTQLLLGNGFPRDALPRLFELFDLEAHVTFGENTIVYNEGGSLRRAFNVVDDHMMHVERVQSNSHQHLSSRNDPLRITEAALDMLDTAGTKIEYAVNYDRGVLFAKSTLLGRTGVLGSELYNSAQNLQEKFRKTNINSTVTIGCILGTFGAGKSHLFKKFMLSCKGRAVYYVSPRKGLAAEFRSLCGLKKKGSGRDASDDLAKKNWHVETLELFLKKVDRIGAGQALIIDEIQLYPPGYLDAVLLMLKNGVHVYVAGDPCQSDYHNEKDSMILGSIGSDVDALLMGKEYKYNIVSRRFKNEELRGRLPCDMGSACGELSERPLILNGVEQLLQIPDEFGECVLVSSFVEKNIVHSYAGASMPVYTFGESTGLNFRRGCILITSTSVLTSERRWITALTRFSENLCIINACNTSVQSLVQTYEKRCLGKFLLKKAHTEDLKRMLPGKPLFTKQFTPLIGKDEGVKEEKLQGDPWLKCMMDLLQMPDQEECEILQEAMQEEWFKTHLPRCELESIRARWVHKILAKEFREKRMGTMVSEQFTDEHSRSLGIQLTNAAERFETIYPRHRANDSVTFIMAVKKRLRFSNPAKEQAKLFGAKPYGRFLLDEFLKRVPLKRAHNEEFMSKAKSDFEAKKVSKSAATIENHSGRSCSDWLYDICQVFSKSQICTKFDNRFKVAKAAQSIVCFQHSVLCRFAPYMRYIEMKLQEVLPRNYYVHSGKGLEELNDWVKGHRFDGVCTESDYEAFDASQDQFIVAFELALMEYLGLPRDLIADYVYIKTHLGSKLGSFAIMRFSGEASTFLFNTMANMLFTFLRYNLKGHEAICFAGDDMCANSHLRIKRDHEDFLGKLKLKAKVQFTEIPTFCGWNLTPDGIFKKPQLVLERICIAKETGNLHNCIDNYAIEVAFAYKLGERAVNRMNEEELEAFYNCVRIIVKKKHLLKSDVADVFKNAQSEI